MKKSLIALVIGAAALGFAQNAKATNTAEVTGTLTGSASTTDMNGALSVFAESASGAFAGNKDNWNDDSDIAEGAKTQYGSVVVNEMNNAIEFGLGGLGAGTIGASGSIDSFGKSSDTNMTVASTSAVSLTAINGNDGTGVDLAVELQRVHAYGQVDAAPALGVLTGTLGNAYSNATIGY